MKPAVKSLLHLTADLMGGPRGASFVWAMECMDVATEELAAAAKHNAKHKATIAACFIATQPTDVLQGKHDLYRSHVREIIMRAILGEPLDPGTDAECLAALSAMSLKAPPSAQFAALFEQLFKSCLPEQWKKLGSTGRAREPYPGAIAELLGELRKKLAKHDRNGKS